MPQHFPYEQGINVLCDDCTAFGLAGTSADNLRGAYARAGISNFLDTHLEAALSKQKENCSLEQRFRLHISRSLSADSPKISAVALYFGMN